MKTLRKALLYLASIITIILVALIASVFLFKDKIIKEFIREANKHLSTPVQVGKIEVSFFQKFPHLSIVLNDVYVEDSHEGLYPLLTAKRIAFQMSPIQVWQGEHTIQGLKIHESETTLKINSKGESNYEVVKKQKGGANASVKFALKNVELSNTLVRYIDRRSNHEMIFTSQELLATIKTANNLFDIEATGQLTTDKISINNNSFLQEKSFQIESKLLYDDQKKLIEIMPSSLKLKNASFSVTGNYSWIEKNTIDLKTKGEQTDIQTLISLLPASVADKLEKYESNGDVYFSSHLKGALSSTVTPALTVEFGFDNATLYHPSYKSRIEYARMHGSFATTDLRNLHKAAVVLKNIEGKLNEEQFKANFIIQDLVDPEVICDFKGKVDAEAVLGFYPVENLTNVTGSLLADIAFNGKIAYLENKATAQHVSTLGSIGLQDINFLWGKEKIPLLHLNGNLQFSNNDLALSNVSGKLGNSDFLLNGFFKNVITFLLFENQPIGIETDLKAQFIDLDQLFSISFGDATADIDQQYTFSISRNINLNFNCDVRSLKYKRFKATAVKGDLLVKNQMAVSRRLSLHTMGGKMELAGIVDAQNNKAIDVVANAHLDGIELDSAFYVFENFRQNFIEDRHLKGKATADVNIELVLNQHLKMFPETLIADISASIKNGQLNNFDPMQKLNKYLDDEGLSRMRFSEIKNDIHIEKKTVFIPQMEIRSNLTNISLSGTHTFDQAINYRLVTPLRRKKIHDSDAEAAIENDPQTGPKLFLKIIGTTDDYKITYDTEAVRKKIANDLKREVQELKDAFKSKGKKKQKEVELADDEYFDWDDN